MATRRCRCGTWFEYDALVRDEAVECPECGRILPRDGREKGLATRVTGSLTWLAILFCVVAGAGGVWGALALVRADDAIAGVLVLLFCVILAGFFMCIAAALRALAQAVDRLEDRIP